MSPHYATHPAYSNTNSRVALTKAHKMLQDEDPRYRNLDRLLARAYIELQKQKIRQRKSGWFIPRMDLCDDPASPYLVASLEVPGTKPDHLSVRIENGRLVVEGERTGPHLHASHPVSHPTLNANTNPHSNQYSYHHANAPAPLSEPNHDSAPAPEPESDPESALYSVRELRYGKFRREIVLPPGVIASHVRSTLVEGMLTISWPRSPALLGGGATQDVLDTPTEYGSTAAERHSMAEAAARG